MARYRKKPVVIEAYQLDNRNTNQPPHWLHQAIRAGVVDVVTVRGAATHATIKTLEGEMRADLNDWIIQGVKGELYPCKPDIFEATYILVEEPKGPTWGAIGAPDR